MIFMKPMDIILTVVICISVFLAVALITSVINLIQQAIKTLESKEKKYVAEAKLTLYNSKAPLKDKMDNTERMLDLIDMLINQHIIVLFRNLASLRTEGYKINNLDKDVKDIASKVFECLNADELLNAEMMVNKDYILRYITQQTTMLILANARQFNDEIRKGPRGN